MAPTPPDAGTIPAPYSYYIERNLSIDEFVAWTTNSPPPGVVRGNPGEYGSSGDQESRLRSIIGPPGVGKTTFLNQLISKLAAHPDCITFRKLDLQGYSDNSIDGVLREWLDEASTKINLLQVPISDYYSVKHEANIVIYCQKFAGRLCKTFPDTLHILVIVDATDELSNLNRFRLEDFLKTLLFPDLCPEPKTKILVARRDTFGLKLPLIKNEDTVYELHGLGLKSAGAEEQIRRRLSAKKEEHRREELTFENLLDDFIRAIDLDEFRREELIAKLSPLTPNPYINLLLLAQKIYTLFPTPVTRLPSDYIECLGLYLERAGLTGDFAAKLIQLTTLIDMIDPQLGTFTISQYGSSGPQTEDIKALMNCGVVTNAPNRRYQLDPGVLQLCRLIA